MQLTYSPLDFRQRNISQITARSNTVFSERHPKSVKNVPFSSKNAHFRQIYL